MQHQAISKRREREEYKNTVVSLHSTQEDICIQRENEAKVKEGALLITVKSHRKEVTKSSAQSKKMNYKMPQKV